MLRPGQAEDEVVLAAADRVVRTDDSLVDHPADLVRAVLAGALADGCDQEALRAVHGAVAGDGWLDLVERAVAARAR